MIYASTERVLLVGVRRTRSLHETTLSLDELTGLVSTAGGNPIDRILADVRDPVPATLIGKGKISNIADLCRDLQIDLVVVDDELSPVQNRNLEKEWGVRVHDRSALILDIFALRARSREGKLQVELAQLEYLAPRLTGRGKAFSQQVGRIGTRGPGETALEIDRRRIRERVTFLRKKLEDVRQHRDIHRKKRESVPLPLISLIGYTNAGKSTLFNRLTGAASFVEDKLFATLDPMVRRLKLPSGREVLLADTVGFLSHLPHELIEAFRATFEEVAYAHVLIHVIDVSVAEVDRRVGTVEEVLGDLHLNQKPRIELLNKIDASVEGHWTRQGALPISALSGEGVKQLLETMDTVLRRDFHRVRLHLPHARGDILPQLYRLGFVMRVDHRDDGVLVDCELHEKFVGKFRAWRVDASSSIC